MLEQDRTESGQEPLRLAVIKDLWSSEILVAALLATNTIDAADAPDNGGVLPEIDAEIPEGSPLRKLDPASMSESTIQEWFADPAEQTGTDE